MAETVKPDTDTEDKVVQYMLENRVEDIGTALVEVLKRDRKINPNRILGRYYEGRAEELTARGVHAYGGPTI